MYFQLQLSNAVPKNFWFKKIDKKLHDIMSLSMAWHNT